MQLIQPYHVTNITLFRIYAHFVQNWFCIDTQMMRKTSGVDPINPFEKFCVSKFHVIIIIIKGQPVI